MFSPYGDKDSHPKCNKLRKKVIYRCHKPPVVSITKQIKGAERLRKPAVGLWRQGFLGSHSSELLRHDAVLPLSVCLSHPPSCPYLMLVDSIYLFTARESRHSIWKPLYHCTCELLAFRDSR